MGPTGSDNPGIETTHHPFSESADEHFSRTGIQTPRQFLGGDNNVSVEPVDLGVEVDADPSLEDTAPELHPVTGEHIYHSGAWPIQTEPGPTTSSRRPGGLAAGDHMSMGAPMPKRGGK